MRMKLRSINPNMMTSEGSSAYTLMFNIHVENQTPDHMAGANMGATLSVPVSQEEAQQYQIGGLYDVQLKEVDAPVYRHITRLAFLQRITMDEHVSIELASIHDPSSTQQQQIIAATLRKMLQMVNAANWIDLDRLDTRQMVIQLEQLGLLGEGRALEVLDNEIQAIERPSSDTPKALEA